MNDPKVADKPVAKSTAPAKPDNGAAQIKDVAKTTRKPRAKGVRKAGGYRVWSMLADGRRGEVIKETATVGKALRWAAENADLIRRFGVNYTLERFYSLDLDGKTVPAA